MDEGEGGLRYRGYAVSDLAGKARFEEVAYLLLFGKLPTQSELKGFSTQCAASCKLPGPIEAFLGAVPLAPIRWTYSGPASRCWAWPILMPPTVLTTPTFVKRSD